MRPIIVSVGPLATASANAVCLSQTPSAAFTINGALATGGVATMDTPRRVLFTTAGDETGKTIALTGTDRTGNVISETLAAPNVSTVASVLDYATVTAISISSAAAGAITVGTNGVAASSWVRFDEWAPSSVSIQVNVSGTVNYTVQQTLDDPNSPTNAVSASLMTWVSHPDSNLVGATSAVQGNYAYVPVYARVLLNSGTGSATATCIHAGYTQA